MYKYLIRNVFLFEDINKEQQMKKSNELQIFNESDDDNDIDIVSPLDIDNNGADVVNGSETLNSDSMMGMMETIVTDTNHVENNKVSNDLSENSCSKVTPEKGKMYINLFLLTYTN